MSTDKVRIVVLISGSGSNLQALIDQCNQGEIHGEIVAVISNRPQVFGLERARQQQIPTHTLDHQHYPNRAQFDQALQALIDRYQPGLVALAGFMRILTADFVQHYQGRMLNIHPSLLPDYKGINTHQRVLDDQGRQHGVSVHFVSAELDGGPVIIQAKVAVQPDDDAATLARRVLAQEHIIYPQAVSWFCAGRLRLENPGLITLDGTALTSPVLVDATTS